MQTFHYTSPQKLCSIINSRSFYAARIVDLPEDQREFSALDATLQHLESLNSQHEVNNLVVFCKNELDKYRDNIYEISFCKNGHSEFMWNNYAKDGCCICFDKENLILMNFFGLFAVFLFGKRVFLLGLFLSHQMEKQTAG